MSFPNLKSTVAVYDASTSDPSDAFTINAMLEDYVGKKCMRKYNKYRLPGNIIKNTELEDVIEDLDAEASYGDFVKQYVANRTNVMTYCQFYKTAGVKYSFEYQTPNSCVPYFYGPGVRNFEYNSISKLCDCEGIEFPEGSDDSLVALSSPYYLQKFHPNLSLEMFQKLYAATLLGCPIMIPYSSVKNILPEIEQYFKEIVDEMELTMISYPPRYEYPGSKLRDPDEALARLKGLHIPNNFVITASTIPYAIYKDYPDEITDLDCIHTEIAHLPNAPSKDSVVEKEFFEVISNIEGLEELQVVPRARRNRKDKLMHRYLGKINDQEYDLFVGTNDWLLTIDAFHVPPVRGFFDGNEIFVSPDALFSMSTGLINTTVKINQSAVKPVYSKYMRRGFTFVLENKHELKKFAEIRKD